jgi:hypothetical protein
MTPVGRRESNVATKTSLIPAEHARHQAGDHDHHLSRSSLLELGLARNNIEATHPLLTIGTFDNTHYTLPTFSTSIVPLPSTLSYSSSHLKTTTVQGVLRAPLPRPDLRQNQPI